MSHTSENNKQFIEKIWIIVGIVAFSVSLLLIIKTSFNVLLLVFAGVLLSVFFRGLSGFIQRKTGLKEMTSVGVSIVLSIIVLVGFFWLMGAKIQMQVEELSETLPKTIDKVRETLNASEAGKEAMHTISDEDHTAKLTNFASTFFKSTFGVFGDLYAVLFMGFFFTISPGLYLKGMVQLIPGKAQDEFVKLLNKLGTQLRKWLKGKLLSMLIVAAMTAIGLAILGIPLWLVLALFAGLVSFIPNFGPIIGMTPAVLVGLMSGIDTALYVVGIFVLIQFIESNFITTTIQQKMVNLPPALILIAQLIMGALTGGWGLVLATPITVVLLVIVKELYINKRHTPLKNSTDGNEKS
ncbi:AI-2E family transporter [Paenimyroides aestuarii]|uniref:AI-2E family transporter n=1 Tax=Paenimyroides aestuarii TaxID=2968490 RepID=A0ABY5NSD5_9FLAO|nr:AI-2E family transporter [Paenimyroides aestuarii]UUV21284.1 AI-2E family transporter [Paenimyroides aestuarii]